MELLIMLVAPLPIGFLVRNRLAAYLGYVAIHGFVFTFQSLLLVLEWAGGNSDAFGPYPKYSTSQVLGYAAVNALIFLAGLGLIAVGQWLAQRRRASARPPAPGPDTPSGVATSRP